MTRSILIAGALLLATVAHAQPGVDWDNAESVSLLMVDNRFVPDRLNLRHGVPYQVHLENHSADLHEFTAPEFLADAIVRNPELLANEGREVVLRPGWAVDLYLMPIGPGTFRMICADHDWDGMVGEIVVE